MKWFKFYGQDYLSDPKMLSLSASERSCWITILAYASVNDNGMITFLSEQQLMLQAGLDIQSEEWDLTVGVLKKLEGLGMITCDNGIIKVNNWQKRQETNLTSYERVKRFREKKRKDNAKITLEENRIEENRIEENRKEKNKREDNTSETSSPAISIIIDFFKEVNPTYKKWFGNKTQRASCERLIKEHGIEKLKQIIALLPRTNRMDYMPVITTPLQLEDKFAQLASALQKLKNNQPIIL